MPLCPAARNRPVEDEIRNPVAAALAVRSARTISSCSAARIATGTRLVSSGPAASISCAKIEPIGSHGYIDWATAFSESNGVTRIEAVEPALRRKLGRDAAADAETDRDDPPRLQTLDGQIVGQRRIRDQRFGRWRPGRRRIAAIVERDDVTRRERPHADIRRRPEHSTHCRRSRGSVLKLSACRQRQCGSRATFPIGRLQRKPRGAAAAMVPQERPHESGRSAGSGIRA